MAGDYTRWTFDPTKDYKSVFKQQGRVDLDADWNELVEITDRRWRTESMDIAGQDFVSEITPDAFLITPAGAGDFNIGIGRLYVDGLAAECHGLPPAQLDAILGEIQETNPVKYSNQPYLPAPLPPVIGAPETTDLIYLDVWEREITAIQDPNIREKALAGPDTCTRLQTVWQVKDLPNVGAHACGDDIGSWDNLIAPSAGRLTNSTLPPNPGSTPCILSQTGGYTGLENRLYRVEIHVAGTLDGLGGSTQAQFKWSRDNASVVAAITGISASGGVSSLLNVSTLGRDAVLRFNVGDWVEVLDDYTEFQGISGHLTKIQSTDPANLTLTVNPPVPAAFNFNPGDPSRHTRVRRWDGRADLNSDVNAGTGLIPVGAGPITIEQGIQVSFSVTPAGGSFKVGDYWIFAARTFDASVEPLVNAPPRGVLHHYCRLGFITWDEKNNGVFSDCRPKDECECNGGCTVTVGDGVNSIGQFMDIQKAINSLGIGGGVVCVGRGVFVVAETIRITRENGPITLLGMGNATRIIYKPAEGGLGVLLWIRETNHIRVESFFMAAISASALIEIDGCSFCSVRDCTLVNLGLVAAEGFGLADSVAGAAVVPSSRAIFFSGSCVKCEIKENALLAAKGLFGAAVQELCIRDNDFLCFHGAVFLETANGLEVQCNLMRGLSPEALKQLQGFAGANGLTAANITVFQNYITAAFAASSGTQFMGTGVLLISGFDVNVSHNRIAAQVAILSIILVEATFESNEILSLVGFFSLFSIMVRVANSLIAGLLIGYAQMGIVIDFVCEANFWLGYAGVIFLPLAEFLLNIAPALATGLSQAKIVAAPAATFGSAQQTGETSVGALRSFGLAATVKIHRNDFFTFLYGVAKFGSFLSADFSIIDNTFSLCYKAGIFLSAQLGEFAFGFAPKASVFASALTSFFNLRHLIQSNSMVVYGTGIETWCSQTLIRDNSITCPITAVGLYAPHCEVLNNTLFGDRTASSAPSGLLQIGSDADAAQIRGNHIANGPCNAILLLTNAGGLVIDDNRIESLAQNGITSADYSGYFPQLSVSRNTIVGCSCGAAGSTFWHGGAIVLPELTDVRVVGNTISGILTSLAKTNTHAIYLDNCDGADISNNLITNNFASASVPYRPTGSIASLYASGEVLVHGNRIRGNGGRAIDIQDFDTAGSISIQHNYLDNTTAAPTNPDVYLVHATGQSFLHFEDNICLFTVGQNSTYARAVVLTSIPGHILVNGNTVQMTPAQAEGAWALEVDSTGQNAIITSNFLTGNPGFIANGTPLAANNVSI